MKKTKRIENVEAINANSKETEQSIECNVVQCRPAVLPYWVVAISSESLLCFFAPTLFWILTFSTLYMIYGFGGELRIFLSLMWAAIVVFTSILIFLCLIVASVFAEKLNGIPSIRECFSEYYSRSLHFKGWHRYLILSLGYAKVVSMTFGFVGIFGTLLVLWVWLVSGSFQKHGV